MEKRHERSLARRKALQILYTSEIVEMSPSQVFEDGAGLVDDSEVEQEESYGTEAKIDGYALRLLEGVEENRVLLDEYIAEASEKWALMRMPIVDRQILRIATYEMFFVDEVPSSVSINEAVELAKDYGGEDESHRFVNGVLGNIAKRTEGEQ